MGLIDGTMKIVSSTAELGVQISLDVASRGLSIAKDAVDGARDGKPVRSIFGDALKGWVGTMRDAGTMAVLENPMAHTTASAAMQVARPMTNAALHATEGPLSYLAEQTPGGMLPGMNAIPGMHPRDDRKQLHERGQELLRRSNALDDPGEHPAFRLILRQMAPDEARIIRLLAKRGPQAMIDVVEVNSMKNSSREVARHVTMVGAEAGCIRPEMTTVYLDNLQRLGLVYFRRYRVTAQEPYDLLEAQPAVLGLPKPEGMMSKLKVLHGGVELSEFGRQLFDACFAEQPGD